MIILESAARPIVTSEQPADGVVEASPEAISRADHDAAVAIARAEGHKAGRAEGLKVSKDRFAAVAGHAAYAGREAPALYMLTTTEMSADAITGVLAGLPVSQPAASTPQDGRSRHAAGGLVLVHSASRDDVAAGNASSADFAKGKEIAASLKGSAS